MWVEDSDGADRSVPALRPLLDWADGLRAALQRAWAPGITLTRRSIQVARYSGAGVGYVRHRDTPADLPDDRERRLVTIVMYLNDGWDAAHGGVLRVYSPDAPTGSGIRDVPPMMGTAVVFLSYLEHEVLPVYRERFAVTVWLYGTGPLFHPLVRTPAPGRNLTPVIPAAARFATTFESNRRIFVSIASYRDVECQQTIRSLFAKAAHPDRVFLGVVHQLKLPDDAPVVPGPHPYPDQVREMRLPHSMATGPCLARHLAQSLYNGERYYLQIDAHMRLTRGWDDKLVRWLEDLRAAGTERPVLTTYPPDYSPGPTTGPCDVGALPDDVDGVDAVPTILCAKGFVSGTLPNQNQNPDEDSGPLLRLQSRSLLRRPASAPPSDYSAVALLRRGVPLHHRPRPVGGPLRPQPGIRLLRGRELHGRSAVDQWVRLLRASGDGGVSPMVAGLPPLLLGERTQRMEGTSKPGDAARVGGPLRSSTGRRSRRLRDRHRPDFGGVPSLQRRGFHIPHIVPARALRRRGSR